MNEVDNLNASEPVSDKRSAEAWDAHAYEHDAGVNGCRRCGGSANWPVHRGEEHEADAATPRCRCCGYMPENWWHLWLCVSRNHRCKA